MMRLFKSATQIRDQRVITYVPNIRGECNELYNLLNEKLIRAVMAIFYANFITATIVMETGYCKARKSQLINTQFIPQANSASRQVFILANMKIPILIG